MGKLSPPQLLPLGPVLKAIPESLLPWIAEKHVQYLDDRIHQIDRLTDYLANCRAVEAERKDFIAFVEDWTKREAPDLEAYLTEYGSRFGAVRRTVEELCDRVLREQGLWQSRQGLLAFWREFTYINEVDSLHGMFLTSGRWHVNVMLPAVKELVYCSLPTDLDPARRNQVAYQVARRVITPRFAEVPSDYDHSWERRFATVFVPVLQHYDRKLLFLFEVFAEVQLKEGATIAAFVQDVCGNPQTYSTLLEMGVYPPFGWHELHASRRRRRPAPDLETATTALLAQVPRDLLDRVRRALDALAVLKEYELNYNNYNYKGRFGLISKYQYWRTSELMASEAKARFLDAILGDRFFEALAEVEQSLGRAEGDR